MRSRLLTLTLIAVLTMSFAACGKKNQPQNTAAPASDNSTAAQPNQSATGSQPASSQPAASQMAPAQQSPQAQQTPPATAQQSPQEQPAAPAPATEAAKPTEPPPPPVPIVIPAGTHIVIRMGTGLTSKTASAGDSFTGSVARPVKVGGVEVIPAGAGVSGRVVNVKSPGKFKGEGVLSIALTAVNIGGATVPVKTHTYTQVVKGKGKRTAVAIGGGTGAGALIGGIAGGGKGAAIGALVGAGAGTAGAGLTGNREVEIPAESAVTFRLAHSITVNPPASPNP